MKINLNDLEFELTNQVGPSLGGKAVIDLKVALALIGAARVVKKVDRNVEEIYPRELEDDLYNAVKDFE